MQEWMNFFINVFRLCVQWLTTVKIFDVPVLAVLAGICVMGVLLRALLYKA